MPKEKNLSQEEKQSCLVNVAEEENQYISSGPVSIWEEEWLCMKIELWSKFSDTEGQNSFGSPQLSYWREKSHSLPHYPRSSIAV